ncbi:hypothetical protein Sjap_015624 [Stephania japonica]|uniref:Uncharacterized protein n=1 Tax=Stephania japonica TaxID=461633 RepID=A0AAP0NR12_9MAGN
MQMTQTLTCCFLHLDSRPSPRKERAIDRDYTGDPQQPQHQTGVLLKKVEKKMKKRKNNGEGQIRRRDKRAFGVIVR